MRTFISFEDALNMVLASGTKAEAEHISLSMALGRTLSEPIVSLQNLPPFASSAMDGFAVIASDLAKEGAVLNVVEHIQAGDIPQRAIKPGTCAKIMTGALFPEGADSVAPVEWVLSERGNHVSFSRAPQSGQHVRPAAEDVREGDTIFVGGEVITPPVTGMLASLGVDPVPVVRRPRVAVISTGDEIVPPHVQPGPAQIRDSNGPALRSQVLAAGGDCDRYEHAADDPAAIRLVIEENKSADILIFSGGVSMGDHDYVKSVLVDMGGEMLFWKVRQRPGKPLAFGKIGSTVFLGLPGNPVSSAMCFAIYARPLIHKMLGRERVGGQKVSAILQHDVKKVADLHHFSRGVATVGEDGTIGVSEAGSQGSNLFSSVVRANCIIHLPSGEAMAREGSRVTIELLPWANLQGH